MKCKTLGCKVWALEAMNNSGSYQFKPLNFVNCLGLWMTLTALDHELSALDTMDTSGLWLT